MTRGVSGSPTRTIRSCSTSCCRVLHSLRSMPQNVPAFEFSDRAKQVRAFVFEFWCEQGRGPTLREVHDATELDRRRIIQAYKELQLGIVITVDENTHNCNLLKAPPFSSYPSQVR